MTREQKREIYDLIAEIRNELGPFWVLSSSVTSKDSKMTLEFIDRVANIAENQKTKLIENIEKIGDIIKDSQ